MDKIITTKIGKADVQKLEVSIQQPIVKRIFTKDQIQKQRDFFQSKVDECDAQLAMFTVTPQ